MLDSLSTLFVCLLSSVLFLASEQKYTITIIDYKKMLIYYSPQILWEVQTMTYDLL